MAQLGSSARIIACLGMAIVRPEKVGNLCGKGLGEEEGGAGCLNNGRGPRLAKSGYDHFSPYVLPRKCAGKGRSLKG